MSDLRLELEMKTMPRFSTAEAPAASRYQSGSLGGASQSLLVGLHAHDLIS